MTPKQLIETVLNESPLDDGNIALIYLNDAQQELAQKSRLNRKTVAFTTQSEAFEHTLTDFTDAISFRDVYKDDVKLVPTELPKYLSNDIGYWYPVRDSSTGPIIHLGWFDGATAQPFESGETFDITYNAYWRKLGTDAAGDEDLLSSPELPARWRMALTYRAIERAYLRQPEFQRYWYARWREELVEAKKQANTNLNDAQISPKVYEL